jgi:hypothetical protein
MTSITGLTLVITLFSVITNCMSTEWVRTIRNNNGDEEPSRINCHKIETLALWEPIKSKMDLALTYHHDNEWLPVTPYIVRDTFNNTINNILMKNKCTRIIN